MSAQPAPLLAWAAEQNVDALREAWTVAHRRFRLAPKGLRRERLEALQAAVQNLLRAELQARGLAPPEGATAHQRGGSG